jgi:transketolase
MALMRVQPNMTVLSPCDAEEAKKATVAAARYAGPVYIRLAREKTPAITTTETPFEFGKAQVLWSSEKPQCAIFATGPLVFNALCAARDLAQENIPVTVVNIHTIKPLDDEAIIREACAAGCVVSVEEHQIAGGLGGAIAETLARVSPLPQEFVGVRDRFGQSGNMGELQKEYGMTAADIVAAVRKARSRVSA